MWFPIVNSQPTTGPWVITSRATWYPLLATVPLFCRGWSGSSWRGTPLQFRKAPPALSGPCPTPLAPQMRSLCKQLENCSALNMHAASPCLLTLTSWSGELQAVAGPMGGDSWRSIKTGLGPVEAFGADKVGQGWAVVECVREG